MAAPNKPLNINPEEFDAMYEEFKKSGGLEAQQQRGGKKESDITADELKSFEQAMEKKEFRDLLQDYMKELADPEQKKENEKYLYQMENQGNTFYMTCIIHIR